MRQAINARRDRQHPRQSNRTQVFGMLSAFAVALVAGVASAPANAANAQRPTDQQLDMLLDRILEPAPLRFSLTYTVEQTLPSRDPASVEADVRKAMNAPAGRPITTPHDQQLEELVHQNVARILRQSTGPQRSQWTIDKDGASWRHMEIRLHPVGPSPEPSDRMSTVFVAGDGSVENGPVLYRLDEVGATALRMNPDSRKQPPDVGEWLSMPVPVSAYISTVLARIAEVPLSSVANVPREKLRDILAGRTTPQNARPSLRIEVSAIGNNVSQIDVSQVRAAQQRLVARLQLRSDDYRFVYHAELRDPMAGRKIWERTATDFDAAGRPANFVVRHFNPLSQTVISQHTFALVAADWTGATIDSSTWATIPAGVRVLDMRDLP